MKEKHRLIILVLVVITIIGIVGYLLRSEYDTKINALMTMDPQQVTIFRIYPRVAYGPFGTPVTFQAPDPIIEEFFHALSDRNSYPISRDRIASRDHNWFLEVATGDIMIQIACYIPYEKGDIVVGMIGNFSKTGHSYDGDFQSRELFQWYRKYSHRWLEAGSKEQGAVSSGQWAVSSGQWPGNW